MSQQVNVFIPPDGGYAWVIVFAAFTSNFVANGIQMSFAVSMQNGLHEALNEQESKIAIINSAQLGMYYLSSPIACAFLNHYGSRAVSFSGSLISAAGILIASFVKSYYAILALYGVIGGIGFGMMNTAAIICVEYNFEKYRALSSGIAVCGVSCGSLCLSPLFVYLVDMKGYEYTMRVQAALLSIALVASIAYRPLKPTQVHLTPEIITEIDPLANTSRVEIVELYKSKSMESLEQKPSLVNKELKTLMFLPMDENVKSEEVPPRRQDSSCSCLPHLCSTKNREYDENVILTGPMDRKDIFYGASVIDLPEYKMLTQKESQLNSSPTLNYHLSMIIDSNTVQSSIQTPNMKRKNTNRRCGVALLIRKALGNLLDVSLLKSKVFHMLAFSCLCYGLGYLTPYAYLPLRSRNNGIDNKYIKWFVSAISIGNTLGRISAGVIPTIFPKVNSCYMGGFAKIAGGTITIISAFVWIDSVTFQLTYCVVFGFFISFLSAVRAVVFVQLLGLNYLTNAFGLSSLAMGVGALAGNPIVSALIGKETSNKFLITPFIMSGSLIILCGIFMILADYVCLLEKRKKMIRK